MQANQKVIEIVRKEGNHVSELGTVAGQRPRPHVNRGLIDSQTHEWAKQSITSTAHRYPFMCRASLPSMRCPACLWLSARSKKPLTSRVDARPSMPVPVAAASPPHQRQAEEEMFPHRM